MQITERISTQDLRVGDKVDTAGIVRTVTALVDLARPAVFGTGTEWHVSLDDREPMAAASSHKWNRVG